MGLSSTFVLLTVRMTRPMHSGLLRQVDSLYHCPVADLLKPSQVAERVTKPQEYQYPKESAKRARSITKITRTTKVTII
jgi:hypothetical protein